MPRKINTRRIRWLASFPKSGNTWIRMFLDAYISGRPPELNNYFGHYVQGDLRPVDYQSVCPWPIGDVPKSALAMLRPAMLVHLMAHQPTQRLCLKTHDAKIDVDGVPRIPPTLTESAIYLVRDPRDIAVSWSHHANCSLDRAVEFVGAGLSMPTNDSGLYHLIQGWSDHVVSWTADNEDVPTTVIRYEDLLSDPEPQFIAVLKGLGFEKIKVRRVRKAMRLASFEKLHATEEKTGFREKRGGDHFFRQGKAGGWRDTLKPWHVRQIEGEHSDVMAAMGYALATTTIEELTENETSTTK